MRAPLEEEIFILGDLSVKIRLEHAQDLKRRKSMMLTSKAWGLCASPDGSRRRY